MSQIYIQEPPTSGRVILHTTIGDIDIELWCRETPRACRNFIQLCLEGYYDDVIFHRVIKDFIVQTGDPTGTGMGGESIYGEPFADEYHSRLRFTRRGLVGMATASINDNTSQFFITLGATPELQNKHTLFGRVGGDTIFNVLKVNDLALDEERPIKPPKIIGAKVLDNFFDDIVPRTTAAEKRAIREAQEKRRAALEAEKKRPKKGVKNKTLLSFGDDEDGMVEVKKSKRDHVKIRSSHDVLDNDPRLSRQVAVDVANTEVMMVKKPKTTTDETSKPATLHNDDTIKPEEQFDKEMREKILMEREAKAAKKTTKKLTVNDEIARVKDNIRAMEAKRKSDNEAAASDASASKKESWLEQSLAQYKNTGKSIFGGRKRRKAADESQTLAMLDAFTSKLAAFSDTSTSIDHTASSPSSTRTKQVCELHQVVDCESCNRQTNPTTTTTPDNNDSQSNPAMETVNEFTGETWDEQGWLNHHLTFEKDTKGKDLMKRRDNIDDYVVIDPRVRDAQAKRLDKSDRSSSTRRYSERRDRDTDRTRHRHRR